MPVLRSRTRRRSGRLGSRASAIVGERTVTDVDTTRAMQLALGYWPARAFSAAGELGVYDLLAREGALDAATIADRLGIRSRSLPDLLGALVELGVLSRSGATYDLAGDVPDGEILAMADAGSLRAWADLPS